MRKTFKMDRNYLIFYKNPVFFVTRIKDLEELQYLYPDIPKDDAFGKFYSKIDGNRYVACIAQ